MLKVMEQAVAMTAGSDAVAEAALLRGEQAALLRRTGNATDALRCYQESLRLSIDSGDDHTTALALANHATFLRELGQMGPAEEQFRQARELVRALGDRNTEATILVKLATLTADLGRSAETAQLCQEAAELARSLGNRHTEARAMLGAAGAALRNDEYSTAESTARKVLEFKDALPVEDRTEAYGILALTLLEQQRRREALAAIEEAIAAGGRLSTVELATIHSYAGVIHHRSAEPANALQRLDTARDLVGDVVASPLTVNINQVRGDVHLSLGDIPGSVALSEGRAW